MSSVRQVTSRISTPELPGRLQLLDGDAEILPGLTALQTTGHTPGHHAFRFDGVLFAGDAARCIDGRLVPMPSFIDDDPRKANAALARLRALDVTWYACGHSDPARKL